MMITIQKMWINLISVIFPKEALLPFMGKKLEYTVVAHATRKYVSRATKIGELATIVYDDDDEFHPSAKRYVGRVIIRELSTRPCLWIDNPFHKESGRVAYITGVVMYEPTLWEYLDVFHTNYSFAEWDIISSC